MIGLDCSWLARRHIREEEEEEADLCWSQCDWPFLSFLIKQENNKSFSKNHQSPYVIQVLVSLKLTKIVLCLLRSFVGEIFDRIKLAPYYYI